MNILWQGNFSCRCTQKPPPQVTAIRTYSSRNWGILAPRPSPSPVPTPARVPKLFRHRRPVLIPVEISAARLCHRRIGSSNIVNINWLCELAPLSLRRAINFIDGGAGRERGDDGGEIYRRDLSGTRYTTTPWPDLREQIRRWAICGTSRDEPLFVQFWDKMEGRLGYN